MTVMKAEEYFPRGGSTSKKPALRKDTDKLFKKQKKLKKRNKKPIFFEEKSSKEQSKKSKSAGVNGFITQDIIRPLTYQSLEEGMVMVGRVREVLHHHMFLCLPGRLSAKVPAAAVSAPYTDSLARLADLEITQQECPPLNSLFHVGETVVCSIVEVKKTEGLLSVSVSLEPGLVNRGRGHYTVRAGHVIMAAVLSCEDYGYTLHTGIGGLTAFLPATQTTEYIQTHNQGRSLVIGEVLRCLVTKCKTGKSASRAEVTIASEMVSTARLSDPTSQTLLPPAIVTCTVDRVMGNGLVVKMNDKRGYIEVSQLEKCWSLPKHYKPECELTASVLYVLPHTDFQVTHQPVYLTLKHINDRIAPAIPIGEVIKAKVVSSGPKGLFICLGKKKDKEMGNKGFVSIRRLGEKLNKEQVSIEYPKGKPVTTRILAFDYMEEVYNCSLERHNLEQQDVKQLSVGDRITCEVTDIEDKGLRLALGSFRLYVYKEHTADKPFKDIYRSFQVGDVVDGRVLKTSHGWGQVIVTLKETLIRTPALTSYDETRVGYGYWGTIRFVRETSMLVDFYNGVHGNVQLKNHEATKKFHPGELVKCYIKYVNAMERKLLLSVERPEQPPMEDLERGELCDLVVTEDDPCGDAFLVSAVNYHGIVGIVPKSHLKNPNMYKEGDFLKAWMYQKKGWTYHFSPNPAIHDFLKVEEDIKRHAALTCCVVKIGRKNISLSTALTRYPTVEISNKDWPHHEKLRVHEIVEVFVSSVDKSKKVLEVTLDKPQVQMKAANNVSSSSKPSSKEVDTLPEKARNENEKSKAKHVENADYQNNSSVVEECSKMPFTKQGKHVHSDLKSSIENLNKSSVLPNSSTNKSKKRSASESEELSDTLTPRLPEVPSPNKKRKKRKNSKTDFKQDNIQHVPQEIEMLTENDKAKGKMKSDVKNLTNKLDYSDSEDEYTDEEKTKIRNVPSSKLTLSESGFLWDIKPENMNKQVKESADDDNEGEEEDSAKGKKKKTAAERRKTAKEEEARLRLIEQSLLESESNPQSVDHFDRAVLAKPDDADLWIKYMSYHLQATEIEKARAVARRALQTINHRHDVERLNVWIALLNLENLFGTQESIKNCLNEALQTNDEFTVYCKMLQIYSDANKSQETEHLVGTMVRKFRESAASWLQCCAALMRCGLADKARNLLQRAITALPLRQHINLLCQFALLENQHGFSEQAQTLFEHILTSYPKRTDIWSVYVDMLVKAEKTQVAREILERATRQKLPARKMKTLFSKWVSFEERFGTPEKVGSVRQQAENYVKTITMKLE